MPCDPVHVQLQRCSVTAEHPPAGRVGGSEGFPAPSIICPLRGCILLVTRCPFPRVFSVRGGVSELPPLGRDL